MGKETKERKGRKTERERKGVRERNTYTHIRTCATIVIPLVAAGWQNAMRFRGIEQFRPTSHKAL